MNFFEAQEQARKSSRRLIWLFALAVIGVIVAMHFFVVWVQRVWLSGPNEYGEVTEPLSWLDPVAFGLTAIVIGGMILLGSGFKLMQLRGGGRVVANDLGGRQIEPDTRDFSERQLLNVVEEMAIASGLPVPEVWVMDHESSINAFAAGTDPSNAVIGVSRGTLDRLDRQELQGVIAHEFSHILNGDMRLNMRLIGFIFGLVMISMLGRILLEMMFFSRAGSRRDGNGAILAIAAAAIAIWIIGSLGVLAARLIQAAISRQREYLADAAAVQFTRDPSGISGALKKIGGYANRGKLKSAKASEARHMFFASSVSHFSMATHPPLEKRIRAIEPNWQGEMIKSTAATSSAASSPAASGFAGTTSKPPELPDHAKFAVPIDTAGRPDIGEANHIQAGIAATERDQFPHPYSKHESKWLMLGLIIGSDNSDHAAEKSLLESHEYDADAIEAIVEYARQSKQLNASDRLTQVDFSLPWLRKMPPREAEDFVAICHELIHLDQQVDLQEFVLQQVLNRHVKIGTGLESVPPIKCRRLDKLANEIKTILGAFAHLDGGTESLSRALTEYREHTQTELTGIEIDHIDFDDLGKALQQLDAATPLIKRNVLRLCSLVVMHDNAINDREHMLLRATAEAIGAAIPPLPKDGTHNR